MPYRIVTNTSAVSRETLARWSAKLGAPIPAARFESALSASAAWTARHFRDQPLYVLASEDARTEFAGQRLLTHEEAGKRARPRRPWSSATRPRRRPYDNLNRAFRLVLDGARPHRHASQPWWLTPDGPTLDSGAFVAGSSSPPSGPPRSSASRRRRSSRGRPRPPPRGGSRPRPRRHRDGRRRRAHRHPRRPASRPAWHLRPVREARRGRHRGRPRTSAAGAARTPWRPTWPLWSGRSASA